MQSDPCSGKVCTVRCDSASGTRPVTPPGEGKTCQTLSAAGVRRRSSITAAKSERRVARSATSTGSHPCASTTHSQPTAITLVRLPLRFAALGTEFRRSWNRLAAFDAELRCGARLATRRVLLATCTAADCVGHRLAHRHPRAKTRTDAGTAALVRRGGGNRLRNLKLSVFAQIADHVHADPFIEALLQLIGQRQVLNDEGVELKTEIGERRGESLAKCVAQPRAVRGHAEKGSLARREGI